jgi:hypothetical protein
MKKLALFLPIVFLPFFANAANTASTTLYFQAPAGGVWSSSDFSVKILVDSERPINAYAVGLSYPADKLEIIGFDNSRSIIDVSPGMPTVFEGGEIVFKGGSSVPFSGEGGELLTLNFRAKAVGAAGIKFQSPKLYLADGMGTKIVPIARDLTLNIVSSSVSTATEGRVAKNVGGVPPTIKYLSLISDPFNSNQKLLGFLVVSGDSGVKEMSVRSRAYFWWNDWASAQNPTAIPASAWTVDLRITDNAGNVSERIIYDWRAGWKFFVSIMVVAAIIAVFLIYRRKRRH